MRILFGWPAFFLVAAGTIGWDCYSRRYIDEIDYLPGDSTYYAAATVSLVADGDLNLVNQFFPGKTELAEVLTELEREDAESFALSASGQLTLKQSPVLSAAAGLFYLVFGRGGFLIFNVAVEVLLLVGLSVLAGGGPAARAVTLIGFVTSGVWKYSYNFSPDLTLCALIVGSILAARSRRPLWAGLACGVAVSLKIYSAAVLFPVPVLAIASAEPGRRLRAAGLVVAGGIVGLSPGAAFHTWQFGAPWVTGYERQLRVENGHIGLADHSSKFVVPPHQGLRELMAHTELGLAATAPLWFVWPIPAVLLLSGRIPAPHGRGWVAVAAAVSLLNLLLFSVYDGALIGSRYANRYLFPAVVLGFAIIAAAAEGYMRRGGWGDPKGAA